MSARISAGTMRSVPSPDTVTKEDMLFTSFPKMIPSLEKEWKQKNVHLPLDSLCGFAFPLGVPLLRDDTHFL